MTPAVAYLRVSGRAQIEGDGFDRQSTTISAYASANQLQITRTFEELGVSGTTEWANRPAWVEMLQFCLENSITTVLVERLDRLARDLMVQEHILADVQSRSLSIISVHEPDLCLDDPTRKLMRQIIGAISEYDKAMIVLKLRGARQRVKARTGRCEGRKPYGHSPVQASVLAHITALRSRGFSLEAIKDALEYSATPAPQGGRWHINTISRILLRQGQPRV